MKTRTWLWSAILTMAAGVAWAQPAQPGRMDAEPRNGPEMRPEGPRERGGPQAEDPALTEAQEKELTDFIKEADPKMHEHMSANVRETPLMHRRKLAQMWRLHQDPEARGLFVKRAKANASVRELAGQYRKAGEKEKPAIKEKLSKAEGELFDADLGDKELQLKKMQEDIAKRRQLKDKIVARRVEQLTGEDDDRQ